MAATLAAGGSRNDAITVLGTDHLGDDPGNVDTALSKALSAQLDAFSRPEADAQVFEHPAGDMPGSVVLRFRVTDLLIHQWDVARSIGADDTLDDTLVEEVWTGIQTMLPMLAGSASSAPARAAPWPTTRRSSSACSTPWADDPDGRAPTRQPMTRSWCFDTPATTASKR